MAEYSINKGIGSPVEFKGLRAQYLFIFAGGLLIDFILFVIMYMVGVKQWFCICFGLIAALVLVWQVFALNAKYGQYGLMKRAASKRHPRYIISRRKLSRLFIHKTTKE